MDFLTGGQYAEMARDTLLVKVVCKFVHNSVSNPAERQITFFGWQR